ncbi:MAG: ATPase [Proteobacteria bacterium]|jgi:chaperone required for assembly of F1-ATPase|nr:ATPase [Pseudomonadota bacterium]
MKRFYKDVTIKSHEDDFVILLDGKFVKTPEKNLLTIPTEKMAKIIQDEWQAQEDKIKPHLMPITKLANTAIDRVDKRKSEIIKMLVEYAVSDQVCYRADNPPDLIQQQNDIWDPLIKWLYETHRINLKITTGIKFIDQENIALDKFRSVFESMESFPLTAYYNMATILGSVTIGLNLYQGQISIEQAWNAGQLDENYQISIWGVDEEAEIRRKNLKSDLEYASQFLSIYK